MLHIEAFRVADIPDGEPKVWFVDQLNGADDRIGLFFADPEFREEGLSALEHVLTIQAQGWAECAQGAGNARPPVIKVLRVKVKPGAPGIDVWDADGTLVYRIDENWITDAGARGFEEALRERARHWHRLDGEIGYVPPGPQ
jgi:hypothetical protein